MTGEAIIRAIRDWCRSMFQPKEGTYIVLRDTETNAPYKVQITNGELIISELIE